MLFLLSFLLLLARYYGASLQQHSQFC